MFKDGALTVSWPECKFESDVVLVPGQIRLQPGVSVVSGSSGVGKTTMLRAISANNGHVRSILVFQEPTLLPWMTLEENLYLVTEDRADVGSWLDRFDLQRFRALRPGQMSLGMQRRAAIVRGMLKNPDLLLLDEPSASLDQENIQRLLDCIEGMKDVRDVAVLIVSHQVEHFTSLNPSRFTLDGRPALIQPNS